MNTTKLMKFVFPLIGLYALAGFFGVPYALKHILPEKISKMTEGGKLEIRSASFNPFTFRLGIGELSFKTPQNGELFDLKNFTVNVNPFDYLWRGGWVVKEVVISEPKITVLRDEKGSFNFQWLSELKSEEETKEESKPLSLMVDTLVLKEGSLDYRDRSEGKSYSLNAGPIGFRLKDIDLRDVSEANGMMRLYATINDSGFIDVRGKIEGFSPLIVNGNVAFNSGKLYTPWHYFEDKFPIEVADGKAEFGFDYHFNSDEINDTKLSGLSAGIDRLRIIPKNGKRDLFSLGSLRLEDGVVWPMRKEFSAKSLTAKRGHLSAQRSREGIVDWQAYIEEIQKAFPEDENETKEPWRVALGDVALEDLALEWKDRASEEPYHVSADGVSFKASLVNTDPSSTLHADVSSGRIAMVAERDGHPIAGLNSFTVEGITIDREAKDARVVKVSVEGPTFTFKRHKDGTLDVSRYLPVSKKREKPSAEEKPWSYTVMQMNLSEGEIKGRDEVPVNPVDFSLEGLNLSAQGISSDRSSPIHLESSARIQKSGFLKLSADVKQMPMSSRGKLHLRSFPLWMLSPYLEPRTYAALHRGEVSLDADFDYSPKATGVKGRVALHDWVVDETRDGTVLLGWGNIGATPFTYAYPDNRLKINELLIEGLYANAMIDSKKVFNFATLAKPSEPKGDTSPSSGNPFGIDIVKLTLQNSSANFSDLSLPLPFKTYIHDLEGSVLGISTTKNTSTFVKIRGGVDKYGSAKIDGSLNTKSPKDFTDLTVAFDNLELKHYTPYSLQFLGYEIDNGRFFLNLGYKIDRGALRGDNQVVIKQIELGKEKAGGSPWPMRLIVALLEDVNGVIDVDLPVQGDVNNPDFKYGKVVWQVIGNLLTKAVTSPFRLLGSMMGIDADTLSSIDFEPGSIRLVPTEQEKLDHIAQMLNKRPKLALEVYGGWGEKADERALKEEKLVRAAVAYDKERKVESAQAISLEVLEAMAKERLEKSKIKVLRKTLEEQYSDESVFVRHYTQALIDGLVSIQPVSAEELRALADKRAVAITNELKKRPGLEQRVVVRPSEAVKVGKKGEIPIRLEIVVQQK